MVAFPSDQPFLVNLTANTITTIVWAANSDLVLLFYGPNNPNVIRLQRGAQTQATYTTKVAQQVAFQVKSADLQNNYAVTYDPPAFTEGNTTIMEYGFNILGTDNGVTFFVQQVTETLADLKIRFISDTDGKAGKDDDTDLEAALYAADGTKLATYGQSNIQTAGGAAPGWENTSKFDEGSDITKPMALLNPSISPIDTSNAWLQINITPNGNDSWRFNWILLYTWSGHPQRATNAVHWHLNEHTRIWNTLQPAEKPLDIQPEMPEPIASRIRRLLENR